MYNSLQIKINTLIKISNDSLKELLLLEAKESDESIKSEELDKKAEKLDKDIRLLEKMLKEVKKMKRGSIALVNQIVTISKLRIYNPKTSHDVLANIKLSDVSLTKIDSAILCSYTKNK